MCLGVYKKIYVLFIVIKHRLVIDLVYELSHWVNGSTSGSPIEPQCQINFFLNYIYIYKLSLRNHNMICKFIYIYI